MAIAHQIQAGQIGQTFADALGGDEAASDVFVLGGREGVDVWVLTRSLSFEDEDRYYSLAADLMREFTNVHIDFHLANPRLYASDINLTEDVVPHGADRYPLHS